MENLRLVETTHCEKFDKLRRENFESRMVFTTIDCTKPSKYIKTM